MLATCAENTQSEANPLIEVSGRFSARRKEGWWGAPPPQTPVFNKKDALKLYLYF
jgi:hypothetical protein